MPGTLGMGLGAWSERGQPLVLAVVDFAFVQQPTSDQLYLDQMNLYQLDMDQLHLD